MIKKTKSRLGCGPKGIKEIKDHPFFESIDWEKIVEKKVQAPLNNRILSTSKMNNEISPINNNLEINDFSKVENIYNEFSVTENIPDFTYENKSLLNKI